MRSAWMAPVPPDGPVGPAWRFPVRHATARVSRIKSNRPLGMRHRAGRTTVPSGRVRVETRLSPGGTSKRRIHPVLAARRDGIVELEGRCRPNLVSPCPYPVGGLPRRPRCVWPEPLNELALSGPVRHRRGRTRRRRAQSRPAGRICKSRSWPRTSPPLGMPQAHGVRHRHGCPPRIRGGKANVSRL